MITYAQNKGCLIVAAAGNGNSVLPDYPAAYPGVIAVANVNDDDIKGTSSNYGSHIAISAPGTNILSTLYENRYGMLTGTSMASPIVASAAALVKTRFPDLTMEQVRERLRVTADKIDNKNPGLEGMLGKGRLNVYNALTQSSPSIRYNKVLFKDNYYETFSRGDTVEIHVDLKNFLDPASGLKATLTSDVQGIEVLNPIIEVGNISTLETKALQLPFKVFIKPSINNNTEVVFRLAYSSNNGSYNDYDLIPLTVALDYMNIRVNKIKTTITSNGRIGYSKYDAADGLGFEYKGEKMLYEASLLIGTSAKKVSNNARTINGADEHFVAKAVVNKVKNSQAAFEGTSEFDDSGSFDPLKVNIKHWQRAYAEVPYDKFIIAEYEVSNRSQQSLDNVFISLFTDWDVDVNSNDITRYDAVNRLAYAFGKNANSTHVGIKLLNTNAAPAYYPLGDQSASDLLADGEFTMAEKYKTLSSGIRLIGAGQNPLLNTDISFTSGYGPFNIPASSSIKVAFALLAGDNLQDLQSSALAAQNKFDLMSPPAQSPASLELKPIYPNPVNTTATIEFILPDNGFTSVTLYNLKGEKVKTLIESSLTAGYHSVSFSAAGLAQGIYLCALGQNSNLVARKILVIK